MIKAILIILIILWSSFLPAQDEWTILNPEPTLTDFYDAFFLSEQEGWAVGNSGIIMHTVNGGENWEIQFENEDMFLRSVFFIDNQEGWVAGGKYILHTTDGGSSWTQQNWSSEPWSALHDIHFLNADTGIIVGTYKVVLRTENGGESWSRIPLSIHRDLGFEQIKFVNDLHGCIVGGDISMSHDIGLTMVTEDGGATWVNTTPSDCFHLTAVDFINSRVGFAVGRGNRLLKTIDGGYTWSTVSFHESWSWDICFFDSMHGGILTTERLYLTQNGGESWDTSVYMSRYNRISVIDSVHAVAAGPHGLVTKTIDGGYTWDLIVSGRRNNMQQIGFYDENNGMILEGEGNRTLLSTSDGGTTWNKDSIEGISQFLEMEVHENSAYLIGADTNLFKTHDYAQSWEVLGPIGISYGIEDFTAVSESDYFVLDEGGIFLKSNDGGVSWVDISFSDSCYLKNPFYLDAQNGWVIDFYSKSIFYTQNGGQSWENRQLGTVYIFEPTSIFFVDSQLGFASTAEGVLFRTQDGGDNWEEFFVFSSGNNCEMYFLNEDEGWYKASYGVYHTFDGGNTWVNFQRFGNSRVNELFMLNEDRGWLCGDYGLIATYFGPVEIDQYPVFLSSVSLYPNPMGSTVNVELQCKDDRIQSIEVYNLLGQPMIKLFNPTGDRMISVDVSSLSTGVYVLKIRTLNGEQLIKVVKQ